MLRVLAPRRTEEPVTPFREPRVSLAAVIPEMSRVAPLTATFTALVSAIDPAPLRAKVPPFTVVAPV